MRNGMRAANVETVVEFNVDGGAPTSAEDTVCVAAEFGLGICDGEDCEYSGTTGQAVVGFSVEPDVEEIIHLCPDCLRRDERFTLSFR